MIPLLFFLNVVTSIQAVFSNQGFAPRPSWAGAATPATPETLYGD